MVFLAIPNNYRGITPDIYLFIIDNYVNEQKVEVAMQTGAKVMQVQYCQSEQRYILELQIKV